MGRYLSGFAEKLAIFVSVIGVCALTYSVIKNNRERSEPREVRQNDKSYFVVPGERDNFYFLRNENGRYTPVEKPTGLEVKIDGRSLRSF